MNIVKTNKKKGLLYTNECNTMFCFFFVTILHCIITLCDEEKAYSVSASCTVLGMSKSTG